MSIIVSGIRTNLGTAEEAVFEEAYKKLSVPASQVVSKSIVKSSIDARHKNKISMVHTVSVELLSNEEKVVQKLGSTQVQYRKKEKIQVSLGNQPLTHPIVIAGFGPAGMFAALTLARHGYYPIVAERGFPVEQRIKDVEEFWKTGKLQVESNVQFGEGGAGTFSDGKLTTRISDALCDTVLEDFVRFGAPREILTKAKPHIGTDNLRDIVRNIREEIQQLGGQILFNAKLEGVRTHSGKLRSVIINSQEIEAEALVLSIGHSARDTFRMLLDNGVALEAKSFSVGARIEHLQKDIDAALYGDMAGNPMLPPGEYQLSYRENNRGVYTFCMCPGGTVVPSSSLENTIVTNGMSEYARDQVNANSALVVNVTPEDFGGHPLDGVNFQEALEKKAFESGGGNYHAPACSVEYYIGTASPFTGGKVTPSYALGTKEADLGGIFPEFIRDMMKKGLLQFDKKLHGFASKNAILTGVETRTSSPVRITRNENLESISVNGIYPCGEGAGYAGGIVSAAVDGIKVAYKILSKFTPPQK